MIKVQNRLLRDERAIFLSVRWHLKTSSERDS